MGVSAAMGNALVPASYGFRNVIINGNFMVNQRGYVSGTNLASGAYGFDRWKASTANTNLTFTSAPQGQQVVISNGGSIKQVIERANVPAGSYILSWSGGASGRVYNTGATPPAYATSPVAVVLDGTANVEVEFAPNGDSERVWQVQLELGSRPTPFEARPIGVELQLCQRYFETIPVGQLKVYNPYWNVALAGGGQWSFYQWKVEKRTSPAVVTTAGSDLHSFQYVSYNTGEITRTLQSNSSNSLGVPSLLYSASNNGSVNLAVGYTSGYNNNILLVSAEL